MEHCGKCGELEPMCDTSGECLLNRRREDTISERSAKAAVREVFFMIGVNIDDPESLEAFREDLRFNRKLRKLADKGVLATFSLVALSILLASFEGIIQNAKVFLGK